MITNIVLLYSDISKGMKSYGPKAIVPIGSSKQPLIIKQIETIRKTYQKIDHKIYVVLGFDKERIKEILKKHNLYEHVSVIEHDNYIKENQGYGFIQAIERIMKGNLLVIQNGICANYLPSNMTLSAIPILKKHNDSIFSIGVRSNNNKAEYLFYGLEYDWPEICYFTHKDYDIARDLLMSNISIQQKNSMFLFEHLNYLIDHQFNFITETILNKHIKKVINHKEIC